MFPLAGIGKENLKNVVALIFMLSFWISTLEIIIMHEFSLNMGIQAMSLLAVALLAGCSGDSFDDKAVDTSSGKAVDAAADTSVDGGGIDGATEGSADVVQEADEAEAEACDPSEQPPEAVFVSADNGDDGTGDGSASSPLGSVDTALALAAKKKAAFVVLDEGTYKEAITLDSAHGGVTITGGWKMDGTSWKRNCSAQARELAVIASPTRVGLEGKHGAEGITLRTLTVKSTESGGANPNEPGKSCYGILVHDAHLTLEDVVVEACAGQSAGDVTLYFGNDPPDCSSLETNCSKGNDGDPGDNGNSADAGSYTPDGYLPANGDNGTPGANGENGKKGGLAIDDDCLECPTACLNSTCNNAAVVTVESQGKCGCGGEGGYAGSGGPGGGGSFGVYVEGSKAVVKILGSLVRAREGGDGAAGLPGIPGTSGSAGDPGPEKKCVNKCLPIISWGNCYCTPSNSQTTMVKGFEGGKGGDGGNGGNGGGGAGGPSIAILQLGAGKVTRYGTELHVSAGGKGGDSDAAVGMAQEEYKVP